MRSLKIGSGIVIYFGVFLTLDAELPSHVETPKKISSQADSPKNMNEVKTPLDQIAVLTLRIPKQILSGNPVPLTVELRNTGNKTIKITGDVQRSVRVTVAAKNGAVVPKTLFGRDWQSDEPEPGSEITLEISRGEKVTAIINLNRIFDLTKQANYSAKVLVYFTGSRQKMYKIETAPLDFRVDEGGHLFFKGPE